MFLLIYRLTRNSPAPPLYPLTFLVQQSSSGTDAISLPPASSLSSIAFAASRRPCPAIHQQLHSLPLASSSASTSSQPHALAFRVQRCSSGTDTISLPQAEYLASPSQLLAVFVQLSSSGTGTVPLQPVVYLGSTS